MKTLQICRIAVLNLSVLAGISYFSYGQPFEFKVTKPFTGRVLRDDLSLFKERGQVNRIGTLVKDDSVVVLGWAAWLVKISSRGMIGYTGAFGINLPLELYDEISAKSEDLQNKEIRYFQHKRLADAEKKYGTAIRKRIERREYWLGMNQDMATSSLGRPDKVNRTVSASKVSEQWVYSSYDIYLYFENGIMKSFQDSR